MCRKITGCLSVSWNKFFVFVLELQEVQNRIYLGSELREFASKRGKKISSDIVTFQMLICEMPSQIIINSIVIGSSVFLYFLNKLGSQQFL